MNRLTILLAILLLLGIVQNRRDQNAITYPTAEQFRRQCAGFECDTIWSYSQAVLSLSWPGSFCRQKGKCFDGWDTNWDGYSFGIHGYWPTYDDSDLSCVNSEQKAYYKCPDPRCTDDYYFGTSVQDSPIKDLKRDLDQYWPQFGVKNKGYFRQNEWNKHGVCYLKRIMQDLKGKYTKQQIFKYYFESSIQKTKLFGKVRKFVYSNKQAFAAGIGIEDPDTFYISCAFNSGKCYIKEIRLCYDMADPGFQKLTKCFNDSLQNQRYRKENTPLALDNPKGMKEINDQTL